MNLPHTESERVLMWHDIGSYIITAFIVFFLINSLRKYRKNFKLADVWRLFSLKMGIECIFVLATTITIGVSLREVSPIFGWGWTDLFFTNGINIMMAPVDIGLKSKSTVGLVLAMIFLAGVFLALPFWAKIEEDAYRKGHLTWRRIARQSLKFGLIHMFMGISLGVALAIGLMGFFFAYKYRQAYYALGARVERGSINTAKRRRACYTLERRVMKKREGVAILVSTSYHTMCNSLITIFVMCLILIVMITG